MNPIILAQTTEENDIKVANVKSNGNTGKEIRVKPHGKHPSWVVYFYPGGEVPKSLEGEFTSEKAALYAIQQYLENRGII